jgi:hypothetical protein
MVLKYIRAGRVHDNPPPEFSLNAIKSMPDALFLPMAGAVHDLSASNVDLPSLDAAVKEVVLSDNAFGEVGKLSDSGIREKIGAVRQTAPDPESAALIDRAVANYEKFGFFSHFDWRLTHWGTIGDIHSVSRETFEPSTSYLEFTTRLMPPVAAMQELANTFPSVRFKLKFRYGANEPWIVEDLFAFPPFGY